MSCNYQVYLGPYIQVHNPIRTGKKTIKTCSNKGCSKHRTESSDAFCPKCGSPVNDVSIPCKERTEFDVYTEFKGKEPLWKVNAEGLERSSDYGFYTSNMKHGPGQRLSNDAEIIPLTAEDVQKQIDTITIFHGNEISRLKKIFGNDSVQIKWGAIAYWS